MSASEDLSLAIQSDGGGRTDDLSTDVSLTQLSSQLPHRLDRHVRMQKESSSLHPEFSEPLECLPPTTRLGYGHGVIQRISPQECGRAHAESLPAVLLVAVYRLGHRSEDITCARPHPSSMLILLNARYIGHERNTCDVFEVQNRATIEATVVAITIVRLKRLVEL